ncbi:hypothetical protein JL722_15152 [Aureococcus anophagefferens]|nr:hypothetical protein JL722_15152 [Aureococcus anophagefferens]
MKLALLIIALTTAKPQQRKKKPPRSTTPQPCPRRTHHATNTTYVPYRPIQRGACTYDPHACAALDGVATPQPIAATRQDALPAEFPAVDAAEVGANRARLGVAGAARRSCVGDGGNATRWAAIVARAAANKRALARGERRGARARARPRRIRDSRHALRLRPGSPPRAACAFPQRLATHLDAAYGPGAVEVVVRAMSGTGAGRRRRLGGSSPRATTDLLILDYAINDAVVATAKTYDVDDVAGLPEAKAVRQSTEALIRVFTDAGARVAVLCTFTPLSPASWTHWLKPDARGHAASDGSPTFTFVACATEDELRRANRLHYGAGHRRARRGATRVARELPRRLLAGRRGAAARRLLVQHAREHGRRGRYGGPFRQDPHPTYEDHQLIAGVLWYHWLQHAAAAHCARRRRRRRAGEPEPEPELSPEAAPADPCGAVLASPSRRSDAEFQRRQGRDWRYYEDRPAKPGWIGQARAVQRRELGPVSASRGGDEFEALVFRLPCGDGPIRLTILRSYASVGSAQVRVSPPRAPGAAPAVDVDDGAVTLVDAKWDRGESTYETIDVPAPAALRRGRRARRRAPRAARDASRKLKFKLVGLGAPGS